MSFLSILEEKLQAQTSTKTIKTIKDLPNPSTLRNVFKAAKRIIEQLSNGKRMLIVGDYDCDGIMATTILYSFLMDAGYSDFLVGYIIPSRLRDGYGVSPNIIDYALHNSYDFIVTVDNGISALEAVDYANDNNIEVIITDHHTAPAKLPNAYTIVNPRVEGETFPFPWISGATVAWYLVAALKKELGMDLDIGQYLDFVAITVMSDVMPLDDINLALLKYGLKEIKKRNRLYYRLLWNDWRAPTINETSLSFDLVPRINAIGRIDDANMAVEMLLSSDEQKFKKFFTEMDHINEERKTLSREYIKEAIDMWQTSEAKANGEKVIIIKSDHFHEGIVGIIAGKLAEKFGLPAYVLSYNKEKGIYKGSARSVGEVHLYNLTQKIEKEVLGFGGHKGAVGLAVASASWDEFAEALQNEAREIPADDFIDHDKEPILCNIEDINLDFWTLLQKYAPYGEGNPAPIFRTTATIIQDRRMKDGLHFSAKLLYNGAENAGVFFNVDEKIFLEKIKQGAQTFTFNPSLKYDLRDNSFSMQLLGTLDD